MSVRPPAPPGGASSHLTLPHRVVWERAVELAAQVFQFTSTQASHEQALCEPLRAAALAVPAALARSFVTNAGRRTLDGLLAALASLAEVESHLAVAGHLTLCPPPELQRLRRALEVVRRMILALALRVRQPRARSAPQRHLDSPVPIR